MRWGGVSEALPPPSASAAASPTASRRPGWQDWVFTVGSAFFTVSLVPSLVDSSYRLSLWTSAPTALFLFVFAATKWNLRLRFAAVSETVTASMWVLMAVFRH